MPHSQIPRRLRWKDLYLEAELYRAALRVYTKPLFHWRKALSTSTDGKTLYDFAARGLRNLDALHASLERKSFEFRPEACRQGRPEFRTFGAVRRQASEDG